ncbi:hypothetical protein GWI72_04030 [Microvirga tunisiensis]|uniref:Uncharacterized protein n=2 Tax=Pannonibacter tanglangensis TaxID=2750084 RepID=A0ABW9ZG02_9HYPH|nr:MULTISPECIES: hypothetical protein [unclassified Pannonibacter]NBN63785.1 hypothetical protein [Pannonibacter sp. XCT-34]NBN77432.1 hypothetical protein [Pannonibacter sp. XCT-53]
MDDNAYLAMSADPLADGLAHARSRFARPDLDDATLMGALASAMVHLGVTGTVEELLSGGDLDLIAAVASCAPLPQPRVGLAMPEHDLQGRMDLSASSFRAFLRGLIGPRSSVGG